MRPGARAHDNSLRRATRSRARARGDGESHPARRFMLLARCRPSQQRNAAAAFRTSSVSSVFQEPRHRGACRRRSPPPFLPTPPDASARRLPGGNLGELDVGLLYAVGRCQRAWISAAAAGPRRGGPEDRFGPGERHSVGPRPAAMALPDCNRTQSSTCPVVQGSAASTRNVRGPSEKARKPRCVNSVAS